jgi:hypothetical protein
MVFPLKVFKSWVSHRIDDPALPFVTSVTLVTPAPPKKEQKMKNRLNPGGVQAMDGDRW